MISFWDALLVIWVVIGFFVGIATFGSLIGRKIKGMHGVDMLAVSCTMFLAWPFVIWIMYTKEEWDLDE
ncbi:MAG: hypothetical protein KJO69_05925 [Gammaproteobacteria bacterium]|nr:hypothetical protein [Gammaproteobacteria bacterium]